jgi:hypothetical protein
MRHRLFGRLRACCLALLLLPCLALADEKQPFSKEQIEQLVAPIALYPDSLLAQVLMAATYPTDVAAAAKWSKANKDMKGDDAVKAVESQAWDPSVKSLTAFPQVLYMMGEKPDWVQNLGDAFLASSKDVLDAAQRLRTKAQSEGNLKSNEQQKVVVEQQASTQVIKIEPTDPQVIYVPSYNPTVVYGAWPYAAYPPYYPPPYPYYYPGAALATGIAFGIGVGIVNSVWGGCNWGHGDVDINVNKYNNINRNNQITNNKFQHNSANRKGVPYRDSASQQKFGKNVPGASDRQDFRGHDGARDAQRQQAESSLQQRGMDPAAERNKLQNDPQARNRAENAARDTGRQDNRGGNQAGNSDRGGGNGFDRGGGGGFDQGNAAHRSNQSRQQPSNRDNAFSGAGNGAHSRQSMDRGASSRASMGGGGGGHRGGGGGGRGGRR